MPQACPSVTAPSAEPKPARETIAPEPGEVAAPLPAETLPARYRPASMLSRGPELLTPPGINAEVRILFQTIEGLHAACPGHLGDWYFTGDYPTPGGDRVALRAFINWRQGKNVRAY